MSEAVDARWFEEVVEGLDDGESDGSDDGESETPEDEAPVGIGLRGAAGDWLPRHEYVRAGDGDPADRTFLLDPDGVEETVRYFPRFRADPPTVEARHRYAVPITGVHDAGEGTRTLTGTDAGVELVLEFPGAVDVGARGGGSMGFPASALAEVGDGGRYRPVGAKRVAGLDPEKRRLTRFLSASNADWGLAEGTGIVLEGPPGTGKTELVMEVCQERFGTIPVTISGPEILSKWVGESERHLRRKFEEAREGETPVLYIDELDAIARARGEATEDYSAQIVAQLLVLLDGVEAKRETDDRPLKVVASTNLSHVVDPALRRPGRLGSRPIQFERPGERARLAVLHHYLEGIHARASPPKGLGPTLTRFVEGEFDADLLARFEDDLVAGMEGFTGADVEDVVHEALTAVRRSGGDELTFDVLARVLEGEFAPARDYRTEEFAPADLADEAPDLPGIDRDTMVVELPPAAGGESTAAADAVARSYFGALVDDAEDPPRLKYRVAGPGDLLDADAMRTRENAVELFGHSGDERLVVYLRDADRLLAARDRSEMVDRLVGVVTEQVLRWDDDNLLVLDAPADGDSLVPVPGNAVRIRDPPVEE
ncbi:hypothetical protein BRD00_04430 [Halobacteriales archaeon QS_8_69_26]|nr:MAG: hypothetical protein BRD00_04430 [Halobacteriales archaeon QS_8_69_26]